MKNNLKIIILVVAVASLFSGKNVFASEFSGTLSTASSTPVGSVFHAPYSNPDPSFVYTSAQNVSLNALGADSIYYTTDGTNPDCTASSTKYTNSIAFNSSVTIKAISCLGNLKSGIKTFAYTINIPSNPVVESHPGGGARTGSSGGSVSTQSTVVSFESTDFNNDGKVDVIDFAFLMANWGKEKSDNTKYGILDFVALMANWTK